MVCFVDDDLSRRRYLFSKRRRVWYACSKEYGIFDWIFADFYEFSPLIVVLRFRFAIFDRSITYEVKCEFS